MLSRLKSKLLRDSLFRMLVFSYTLFLIFPIVVILLVYHQTEQIISDEIIQLSKTQCEMRSRQLDTQINIIESIMAQLAENTQLRQNMLAVSNGEMPDSYTLSQLPEELKNASFNIAFISNIYIYFHDADLVIADNGVMKRDVAYSIFGDFPGTNSQESWNTLMVQPYTRTLLPYSAAGVDTTSQFAYLQTLPFDEACATLVILVSQEGFLEAAGQTSGMENLIYLLDSQGELLLSGDGAPFPQELQAQCLDSPNMFYHQLEGKDYAVISNGSNVLQSVTYVSMFSKDRSLNQVNLIRLITYLSLLVVLALGFVGVYYFARRNAAPVQQMIASIARKLDISADEFTMQYDAFTSEVGKKLSHNNQKLQAQEEAQRTHFVQDLLLEEVPRAGLEETCAKARQFNIYYEDGDYLVILIHVIDSQSFFDGSEVTSTEIQDNLVSLVLANVLSDLFTADYHYISVPLKEAGGSICAIVSVDAQDKTEEIISEAYHIISTQFGIYFTAAISNRHPRGEWNEAYYEAQSISVRDFSQDDALRSMDDVLITRYTPITQTNGYILTEEMERKLTNYMFLENLQEAKETVDNILQGIAGMPLDYMTNIKFSILNALLKALPTHVRSRFCGQTAPALQLVKCKSPSAVRDTLFSLIDSMHLCMDTEQKTALLSQKIIDYIAAHYSDVSLSVTMIADYLQMNPHYVSIRFKEEIGENLRTYINAYRIQRAKELLTQTNKKLKEVAELVGFIDDNAFIRVFKRFEDTTPGTYREIHKH